MGDQPHRLRAGFLGDAQPVGMHGRARRAQRHEAQRRGDAGHGGGGAHDAAGAGGGGQLALDLADALGRDVAGPVARPVAAAIGAGGKPLTLEGWASIGPVTSMTLGMSAQAAAMSWAGTVLSQPPISTAASMGWAVSIASVSIAIRLR